MSLQRSTRRVVAGVCGGLAAELGVPPVLVRLVTLLALPVMPAVVLVVYLGLAATLPEAASPPRRTRLTWDADAASLELHGPVVPHTVPWRAWLGGWTAVLTAAAGVVAGVQALLGAPPDLVFGTALVSLGVVATLLVPAVALLGTVDRPYTLVCTAGTVAIRRPFDRQHTVPLDQLDRLVVRDGHLAFVLSSGAELRTPLPDGETLDDWLALVRASRRRALAHAEDLDAAAEHRRALDAVRRRTLRDGA